MHTHRPRLREHFRAITGEDGKYRITGLPAGDGNSLTCLCLHSKNPYPNIGFKVDTSSNTDSVTRNFKMKRGVWAEGRVFDVDTQKPMTGQITYRYFQNPVFENQFPGVRTANMRRVHWTNRDGRFRIPVWPTRGVLAYSYEASTREESFNSIDQNYPRGEGAESIKVAHPEMSWPTFPITIIPSNFHFLLELDPDDTQDIVLADMPLKATRKILVKPVWPGVPIKDYLVANTTSFGGWDLGQDSEFEVRGLEPGQSRQVIVYHPVSNLIGSVVVKNDAEEIAARDSVPLEVKMEFAGVIKGRVLDENGEPLANGTLTQNSLDAGKPGIGLWAHHPGANVNPSQIPTDDDGRFRITGIMSGLKYSASVSMPQKTEFGMMDFGVGRAFKNLMLKPGETKDLGDIQIQDYEDDTDSDQAAAIKRQTKKKAVEDTAEMKTQ